MPDFAYVIVFLTQPLIDALTYFGLDTTIVSVGFYVPWFTLPLGQLVLAVVSIIVYGLIMAFIVRIFASLIMLPIKSFGGRKR